MKLMNDAIYLGKCKLTTGKVRYDVTSKLKHVIWDQLRFEISQKVNRELIVNYHTRVIYQDVITGDLDIRALNGTRYEKINDTN